MKNEKMSSISSGEHYCESCDRGWETSEELEQHLATHESCEYDDCTFTAHPKIVAVHVKLQHLSGLFDRIKFSYSKEDIDKWREERKKHYPTQKNIEEKVAAAKEKEERGERVDNTSTSKFNHRNRLKGRGNRKYQNEDNNQIADEFRGSKAGRRRKRFRRTVYIPTEQNSSQRDIVMEEAKQVMKNLIIEEDKCENEVTEENEFSDEEWKSEEKEAKNKEETPQVCKVLAALSAAYNSDSEENEEDNNGKAVLDSETLVPVQTESPTKEGDEAPEEAESKKAVDTPNIYVQNDNSKNNDARKKKLITNKQSVKTNKRNIPHKEVSEARPKKFRKPTLLEMLLSNEIRQERNYILQCIRYIINCNYFEDGPKK